MNENEVLQALRERLDAGLEPGDKIIVEREESGFSVHSEFHEVCGLTLKAAIKSGVKSEPEV